MPLTIMPVVQIYATNWWNSLPADLKELHSFRDFYDSVKSH